MEDVTFKFFEDITYLRVTFDSKLQWNSHMKKTNEKVIVALMACRRVVGQRWDLKSAMMRWIHVLRPTVSYSHRLYGGENLVNSWPSILCQNLKITSCRSIVSS
jgi:hypothetical protein